MRQWEQRIRGELAVYVPAAHRDVLSIREGSGIVGATSPEPVTGRVVIDYEGNLYGAANVRTWADRVLQAEGRHRVQYPTVAREAVRPDALVRVGTLHDESDRVTPRLWVTDRQPLADYLGLDVASDEFLEQLVRSGGARR
jgi:hypothetical protein